MRKLIVIGLHAGYWLAYLLLVTVIYMLPLGPEPFPASVGEGLRLTLWGATLPGVTGFYLFYFYLVPGLLAKRDIGRFVRRGVALCALIGFVLSFPAVYVISSVHPGYSLSQYKIMHETRYWMQLWLFLGFAFMAGLNATAGMLLRGFVSWYLDIRVKEQLRRETLNTRLDLLRAQLHPHFLFNTLNNIDALIMDEPQLASRYLDHLSELLRFMLYQPSEDRVPLSGELNFIDRYLALQQIRTDNPDYIRYAVSGAAGGYSIAPLLFLPFLENAFKYGTDKRVAGAVCIDIDIGQDELRFSCRNMIDDRKPASDDRGGLGLELVRKRLDLLYRDRYQLTVSRQDREFYVSLQLKLARDDG